MRKTACILLAILILSGCNVQKQSDEKEFVESTSEIIAELPTEEMERETEGEIATENVEINEEPIDELPASDFESSVNGKVIVIDAGHGKNSTGGKEPIAPGSNELKAKFATGTHGINQTEEELNLTIALMLQAELEERGAIVHMTRTGHETTMSNVERAEFANNLNADISVKLHADGLDNSDVYGTSMLVPGNMYITDETLVAECYKAGEIILSEYLKATGAKDRGISIRNDMTGFNWSSVPVVLLEMGFMTNPQEDALMETEEYQSKMVTGIVRGLEVYFAD